MRIEPLALAGLHLVRLDPHQDERGFFARTFCRETFLRHGLKDCGLQCSLSHNTSRGTLRGMHWQMAPHGEAKLIRCSRGAIFDVGVDIRRGSSTYGSWHGVELSAENGLAYYIPAGFAHGFVTLTDDADVIYQIADPYVPDVASGFRWDDPDVGIKWPIPPAIISERDASLPLLREHSVG
jgi:dTDP-4-dehydrorhamnose 3,5-epimerase